MREHIPERLIRRSRIAALTRGDTHADRNVLRSLKLRTQACANAITVTIRGTDARGVQRVIASSFVAIAEIGANRYAIAQAGSLGTVCLRHGLCRLFRRRGGLLIGLERIVLLLERC